jgi:hypothetical protein
MFLQFLVCFLYDFLYVVHDNVHLLQTEIHVVKLITLQKYSAF